MKNFIVTVLVLSGILAFPAWAAKTSDAAAKSVGVYEGLYVGAMKTYVTKYEDTLVQIARDHGLGYVELQAANPGVDPWLPGAGVKLIVPTMNILPDGPRRGVVINLPEMRLYYYASGGSAPTSYSIGIGREGLQTPVGETKVVSKQENPTWRPTPRMRADDPSLPEVVLPGPDNPLGTHALYLGWPEYRIHGTNKPFGIGRRSSSGCIRMYPEDIVALYPRVRVGETVTVVNQPVKAAWIGDSLYVEAHPTIDQALAVENSGGDLTYEMSDDDMRIIMRVAGAEVRNLDWQKIRTIIRERRGYPIEVAERRQAAKAAGESNTPG